MYETYKNTLAKIQEQSLSRKLLPIVKKDKYIFIDEKRYLNLSSNDYLGIAENKELIKEFLKNNDYSFGSASSRLLTGSGTIYAKLEELLAGLYNKNRALLFNSGYHANVGIMSALLSKKDVVFSDKLNHASIIDGIKLSEAKMFRYKHLNYNHLEELLQKHRQDYENAIIVSESLFSMDGDICNFRKLIELKNKYNAILVIDEAHAFGVYGNNGLGLAEDNGCIKNIDVIVATFGKACASVGAFCTADETIINYLINKSRPLIFSTALPEINIAFSYHIIKNLFPNFKEQKKHLQKTSRLLRDEIKNTGLTTIGDSHIIPVILGTNECAVECSDLMMKNGYYLLPIRHPTVAPNSSRIRISLRADITFDEIKEIPPLIKNHFA